MNLISKIIISKQMTLSLSTYFVALRKTVHNSVAVLDAMSHCSTQRIPSLFIMPFIVAVGNSLDR